MKQAIFNAGLAAFRMLPVPLSAYRRLVRREVVGVFYHVVSGEHLPHVRHVYAYQTPEQFAEDLRYLNRAFHPVSYQEVRAAVLEGRRLPPRAVMMSFDDGFAECETVIRPLLREHGVPCTFFLTTAFLDNGALMWRNLVSLCIDRVLGMGDADAAAAGRALADAAGRPLPDAHAVAGWLRGLDGADERLQAAARVLRVDEQAFLRDAKPYMTSHAARRLAADGFTLGAHGLTHPVLRTLGDRGAMEAEIVESCRAIAALAGTDQVPFAFPFHGRGVDRGFLADIRARNPVVGLYFDTGGFRRDQRLVVQRVWADPPGKGGGPAVAGHLAEAYRRHLVATAADVARRRPRGQG